MDHHLPFPETHYRIASNLAVENRLVSMLNNADVCLFFCYFHLQNSWAKDCLRNRRNPTRITKFCIAKKGVVNPRRTTPIQTFLPPDDALPAAMFAKFGEFCLLEKAFLLGIS